jgi:23S rRNA (cytidine2498-2'-O)-methyltransferase
MNGYLAPIGFEEELQNELNDLTAQYGRLMIADGPVQKAYWAQNIWYDPCIIPFQSVSDAAKKLRHLNGLWAFYPYRHVRRGELIASHLPNFKPKPLPFPAALPTAPLGSWTLIDSNTLLASKRCSSPFMHGEMHFQESKIPPGRAYLKLWEILTRLGRMPRPKEKCLEIGASPGSWTWVLQQTGAEIIAVDRAPLAPAIAELSNVAFLKKDAFSIKPKDFPGLDWVFSDVVCYPEKLFAWLHQWVEAKVNLVVTIKFQGPIDRALVLEFEKKGELIHLFHNKHELTFFSLPRA